MGPAPHRLPFRTSVYDLYNDERFRLTVWRGSLVVLDIVVVADMVL